MIVALFAFTPAGKLLRDSLAELLKSRGHQILPEPPQHSSLAERAARAFSSGDALVFIGAAGIAVRAIAPFLHSKTEDPAVTVIDEKGQWAVSLLSGHLGGANAFTLEVAELLGAQPVITTATDINGVFAADLWAKANGLAIGNMEKVRTVSMRLLQGEEILLASEYPITGKIPQGIKVIDSSQSSQLSQLSQLLQLSRSSQKSTGPKAGGAASLPGIRVSIYRKDGEDALWLIPRCVYLGIGCRKGVGREALQHAVMEALSRQAIDIRSVAAAGTIDIKKDEPALAAVCREKGWPLLWYTADELKAAGDGFTPSAFVFSAVGVDNVCERAAFLASRSGSLVISKFAGKGVTVAAAAEKISLAFEAQALRAPRIPQGREQ
ncbi:MAG: cobalamin biosynthesis protein [Treponema sp.]|jgi:cobalt-precorrin 5A hydrolase|nr:cobalamin biosynthesis protein [Treponema sp.]